MKLVRTSKQRLEFHLGKREKDSLEAILGLYPCLPPAYQPLSRTAEVPEANQALLNEALAELRTENRRKVQSLLRSNKRLAPDPSGWRLVLSRAEFEWLLQVLNDVRLGNWVLLGSPGEHIEVVDEKTVPHVWAMDVAGHFQMSFLHCVEGDN